MVCKFTTKTMIWNGFSFVHGNIRLSTTSIVLDPQNAYFSINKRNVSA